MNAWNHSVHDDNRRGVVWFDCCDGAVEELYGWSCLGRRVMRSMYWNSQILSLILSGTVAPATRKGVRIARSPD